MRRLGETYWVDHVQCAELSNKEDRAGDHETPNTTGVEHLDEKIGSDACVSSQRGYFPKDGLFADLPLSSRPEKLQTERIET